MSAAQPNLTTALDLITTSLQAIGVYQLGEPIPNMEVQAALRRLNGLIGSLAIQRLSIPTIARTVWPLLSGYGSPENPYFLGPSAPAGSFVQPTRPNALESAAVVLGGTTPAIEIPRAVYTDDAYDAIQIKDLSNVLFTGVYYQPTVPNGTIILWPVPNTALNSLVLYTKQQLVLFQDLVTAYTLPDGYPEMFENNLAVRLAPSYGVAVTPDVANAARLSLTTLLRANVRLSDLAQDLMVSDARGGYNILTGTGG
jgi:hypothetical protein